MWSTVCYGSPPGAPATKRSCNGWLVGLQPFHKLSRRSTGKTSNVLHPTRYVWSCKTFCPMVRFFLCTLKTLNICHFVVPRVTTVDTVRLHFYPILYTYYTLLYSYLTSIVCCQVNTASSLFVHLLQLKQNQTCFQDH